MIEDKDLGLKVAETPEEEIWERFREARESSIKSLNESLVIEKEMLKLANKKLQEIENED